MGIPSLYFHIPFCHGKCHYCGFYSHDPCDMDEVRRLIDTEQVELSGYMANYAGGVMPSIYIGGGSPSAIKNELPDFIDSINGILANHNIDTSESEFTVEVNPGDIDADFIAKLKARGVNRISIGSQSFDDTELKLLGRRHKAADIYTAVDMCRAAGIDNISIDLIFALPGQSMEKWLSNLHNAISIEPRHISVYSLTWEPGTEFDNARRHGRMFPASDDLDRDMYYTAIDKLKDAGIDQYEISNFAIKGYESRHNLRYWQDENYIAIGPAGGSHIDNTRWDNIADTSQYIQRIKANKPAYDMIHESGPKELFSHAVILALRTIAGINIAEITTRFRENPAELFQDTINKYEQDGILQLTDTHIKLTSKGLSYADAVSADFIL